VAGLTPINMQHGFNNITPIPGIRIPMPDFGIPTIYYSARTTISKGM